MNVCFVFFQLWVVLLSDMLLMTRAEPNGQYTVIEDPIYIEDIAEQNFACERGM